MTFANVNRALFSRALQATPNAAAATANLFRGLAPTQATLGDATHAFARYVLNARPMALSWENIQSDLYTLLVGDTPPSKFSAVRRKVASAVEKMDEATIRAILSNAGWDSEDPAIAGLDPGQLAIRQAMLGVDAGAAYALLDLEQLVAIKSVSTGKTMPNSRVEGSAALVKTLMERAGLKNIRVLNTEGANPSVYGEIVGWPNKPTVWLYSHHDVQAVSGGKWHTDPWRATLRPDGRIYGRGTADDKAGIVASLASIKAFRAAGRDLPVNIGVLVEGEEEIGSPNLEKLVRQLNDAGVRRPDVVILLDSDNRDTGVPAISLSARGVFGLSVEVETAAGATHSGANSFVPNALNVLTYVLGHLSAENLFPVIPGLTDSVPDLPDTIRATLHDSDESTAILRKGGMMLPGVEFVGAPDIPVRERIGGRYAVHVLAIEGTQGMDNIAGIVVPKARAALQFRVPPTVDMDTAMRAIEEHLVRLAPHGIELKITARGTPIYPWLGDVDSWHAQMLSAALSLGYGTPAVFEAIGGSIGLLGLFKNMYPGVSLLPVGIEDPYSNAHGANESLAIEDLLGTSRGLVAFLDMMGRQARG